MNPRILIVNPYNQLKNFKRHVASQMLLWALDRAGIGWKRHQPAKPAPDLNGFDAALIWGYGFRYRNFMANALTFEQLCRARGLPVINSAETTETSHAFCLSHWQAAGIPCARHQAFERFEDIELTYPLILRRNAVHRGIDVFLARNPGEARAIIEDRLAEASQPNSKTKPLNLAIEFIDRKHGDGKYRKFRSFVVGDRVLPRHLLISEHWLVNFWSSRSDVQTISENRQFHAYGDRDPALLVRAARALKADVVALDYDVTPDGDYLFFEGNRHFSMVGDDGYVTPKFYEATGRSAAEHRRDDEALGEALGAMILGKLAAFAASSGSASKPLTGSSNASQSAAPPGA